MSAAEESASDAAERFRFRIPARLEYRDAARSFIAFVCDRLATDGQLPVDLGHRVISAFIEAFNNTAIHAYRGQKAGAIDVELAVGPEKLWLRVADEGKGFAPDAVPEPELDGGVDTLPEGGMGLFIMRSFMDRVDFHQERGQNVLIMEKALSKK